jgi:hypothetical protein
VSSRFDAAHFMGLRSATGSNPTACAVLVAGAVPTAIGWRHIHMHADAVAPLASLIDRESVISRSRKKNVCRPAAPTQHACLPHQSPDNIMLTGHLFLGHAGV